MKSEKNLVAFMMELPMSNFIFLKNIILICEIHHKIIKFYKLEYNITPVGLYFLPRWSIINY